MEERDRIYTKKDIMIPVLSKQCISSIFKANSWSKIILGKLLGMERLASLNMAVMFLSSATLNTTLNL